MAVTDQDLDTIPGWFDQTDRALFRTFLPASRVICGKGNLVEVGVFMGMSATLMGDDVRPEETFTVIDLFGSTAGDDANDRENRHSYPGLKREAFQANYLRYHKDLPVVVQDFSDRIVDHVPARSCRFVHVDGSHLYEHVVKDVASARRLLQDDGLVVFDDYRSAHAPGVAAAVWTAIANDGLRPVVAQSRQDVRHLGRPRPVAPVPPTRGPLVGRRGADRGRA